MRLETGGAREASSGTRRRFRGRVAWLLAVALPLLAGAWAEPAAAGGEEARVKAIDERVAAIDEELRDLLEERQEASDRRDELHGVTVDQEKLRADALATEATLAGLAARGRREIADLEQRIARLRSPAELAEAWKRYQDAGQSPDAFRQLFFVAKGREPNSSEMSNRRIEALMIEREVRIKVAIPVGRALVAIGGLVTKFVTFTRFSSTRMMSSAWKPGGAGGGQVRDLAKKVIRYRALTKYSAPFRKYFGEEIADTLDGVSEAGGGVVRGMVSVMAWVDGFVDPMARLSKTAAEISAEGARQADIALYGTENRAEDEKRAIACRDGMRAWLAGLERVLAPLTTNRKRLDAALKALRVKRDGADALLKAFAEKEDQLRAERLDLVAEKEGIEAARILGALGGRPCFRRVSAVPPVGVARGNPHVLAADGTSAAALGLPLSFSCRTLGDLWENLQVERSYVATSKTTGRSVTHKVPIWTLQHRGNVWGAPQVKLAVTGPAVTLDAAKGIVRGVRPGKAEVRATTGSGITGEKWVKTSWPSPCDRQKSVTLGKLDSTSPLVFQVWKATGLRLLRQAPGGAVPLPSGKPIELSFGVGARTPYGGAVFLQPVVDVDRGGGKTATDTSGRGVGWKLTTREGAFATGRSWKGYRVAPLRPGRATLVAALSDGRGGRKYPKGVEIEAVEITGMESEVPPEFDLRAPSMPCRVPIGDEFRYRVTARGPDLSRYEVRWSAQGRSDGGRAVSLPGTTGFRRDGDRWVSETRGSFGPGALIGDVSRAIRKRYAPPLADLVTPTPFQPRAEVVRKSDGAVVAVLTGRVVQAGLPPVTDLKIVEVGAGFVRIADFDVFVPTTERELLRFTVQLVLAGGKKVTVPLGMADVVKLGGPRVLFLEHERRAVGRLLLEAPVGDSRDQPSSEMGFGVIQASLDAVKARQYGIRLTGEMVHDSLQLRFDKLVVRRVEEDGEAKYVATVYGPSDMRAFTVRWTLTGGRVETTRLAAAPGGFRSELPVPPQGTRAALVQLLNGKGRVVAVYDPDVDGPILAPPSISLYAEDPDTVTPGKTVVAHAVMHALAPHEDLLRNGEVDCTDYVCVFEVTPGGGVVTPAEGEIRQSLWWGLSDVELRVADDPGLAGRDITLTAKLMMKVGPERVEVARYGLPLRVHEPGYEPPTRIVTPLEPVGPPVGVVVQRVENIDGLNPLDPRGPTRNWNGRVYPTTGDLLDRGGDDGGGEPEPVRIGPFSGNVLMGLELPYETNIGSLDVDVKTGKSRLTNDLSGRAICLRTPPDEDPHKFDTDWVQAFPKPGGGFALDPPAARITFRLDAGPQVFRLRHDSGVVIEVELEVTVVYDPNYGHRLTVRSVRQVGP